MTTLIEKRKLEDGLEVELHWDHDPPHPRNDSDNLGVLKITRGNQRYVAFVDEDPSVDAETAWVSLPVYVYAHSGVAYSTTPFGCQWDSWQAGCVCTTEEKAKEWFGAAVTREQVTQALKAEISTLDDFSQGQVYGYIVRSTTTGDEDSCWGFYGPIKDVWDEAELVARNHLSRQLSLPVVM